MSQALPAASRLVPSSPRPPGSLPLWLPILLYLLLSAAYLFAVPVGESPDEPGHLQCIGQAALGRLPQIEPPPVGAWWSRAAILSGRMCYHMPLYYLLAGGLQRLVHGRTPLPPLPPNHPEWDGATGGPMFTHTGKTAWYIFDEAAAVTLMRLAGIALGVAVLWAADRAAHFLQPEGETTRQLALLLLAGWPQFLFMSRAVSNDTLATALGAVALALLLHVGRPNRYVWLGGLACLAVLTKITMVFLPGVLLAAFLMESLVVYHAQARAYIRPGLILSALFLALAALLGLQPTLRSHLQLSELSFGVMGGGHANAGLLGTGVYLDDEFGLGAFRLDEFTSPPMAGCSMVGYYSGRGSVGLVFFVARRRHARAKVANGGGGIVVGWSGGYLRAHQSQQVSTAISFDYGGCAGIDCSGCCGHSPFHSPLAPLATAAALVVGWRAAGQ
ncbi:MAG: hypothetical protein Fur0021_35130 [Candidatus Promineifilaceae bacterium]